MNTRSLFLCAALSLAGTAASPSAFAHAAEHSNADCHSQKHSDSARRACAPLRQDFETWLQKRYVEPFMAGDTARWVEVFAPSAVALHDMRPADQGLTAIAAFGGVVAQYLKVQQFDLKVQDVKVEGRWAYVWGEFNTVLLKRPDESPSGLGGKGKFFMLWERQSDGQWKILIDMGNRLPT